MPQVSVIMPAYKTEEYIKESIQSVQNQTLQDWELLVINDGSPDHLEDIVTELAMGDHRIRLISQVNQGVAVARNTGIAEATGEFISFLDSDDLWEPTFLEQMTKKALRENLDFVYCGFNKETPSGKTKDVGKPYLEGNILWARIFERQPVFIGAILISSNLLKKHHLTFALGCKFAEDVEFITKILALTEVGAIPEQLFTYRYRVGSAQRSAWNPNRQDILTAMARTYDFIDKNYFKTDRTEILIRYRENMSSQFYRLLWGAVASGYYDAAYTLLDTYPELSNHKAKKWTHDLKLQLLKSRNPIIWRMLRFTNK